MNRRVAQFVTTAGATVALPLALFRGAIDAGWGKTLPERLGYGDWRREAHGNNASTIWIHAASVGEVAGIAPLIKKLRALVSPDRLLITTTSLTGKEEALRREFSRRVYLLPFDHPTIVGRVLDRVQPAVAVIAETEIWPGFLYELAERGIPAILVNGRISDRSFPRYQKFRALFEPVLQTFRRLLVQGEIDQERFIALGADRKRTRVTGSTKHDQSGTGDVLQRDVACKEFGLQPENPVFVAGSVRSRELEAVVDAVQKAKQRHPKLQCILVPRHPERFEAAAAFLERRGIPFRRRSERFSNTSSTADTLLLDTMGELNRAYGTATVAFVGGTLVPIGGHNILEPARFQVPILVGSYTANVRDVAALLRAQSGMIEVGRGEELAAALTQLLDDPVQRKSIGDAAYRVWTECAGVTDVVLDELRPFIAERIKENSPLQINE